MGEFAENWLWAGQLGVMVKTTEVELKKKKLRTYHVMVGKVFLIFALKKFSLLHTSMIVKVIVIVV